MWVDEDPATNRPPTEFTPEIMNALQEELATLIEWAGLILAKADNTQLKQALLAKFATLNSPDFTGAPKLPSGVLIKTQDGATEGGELLLEKSPGSTLAGNVAIDLNGNSFRIFETGGTGRGITINIANLAGAAGSTFATVSDIATAIANLVASSPAALDTLNELAVALGNDPNFATTITNALAGKAPLASPDFSGNPLLPTGSRIKGGASGSSFQLTKGTAGTNLAGNLQFEVNGDHLLIFEAGGASRGVCINIANQPDGVWSTPLGLSSDRGNLFGAVATPSNSALTLAQLGQLVIFYGATAAQTLTLPAVAGVAVAKGYWFVNQGSVNVTVKANAAETIRRNTRNQFVDSNSITLTPGECLFVLNQGGIWACFGTLAADAPLAPAGLVAFFAMNSPQSGWLKANGAAISRTAYPNLYAAIGTYYGAGDGATTFNVPDLRGEFVRGWEDGKGTDPARVFGSAQADDFKSHVHTGGMDTMVNLIGGGSGGFVHLNTQPLPNTGATGGTETRPRNVALLACIKY